MVTIYDIQLDGCRYGIVPVIFAALLLYSAVDWYRGKRWLAGDGQPQAGYSPKVACVFFGILALVALAATWGDYFRLLRAIEGHQVETIEGTIANFHAAATIRSTESFEVAGHAFAFSKFAAKQGFNTLSLEGSPLADGRTVRVDHVRGQIVKLEIAQ
jgi:hypothetical protein